MKYKIQLLSSLHLDSFDEEKSKSFLAINSLSFDGMFVPKKNERNDKNWVFRTRVYCCWLTICLLK